MHVFGVQLIQSNIQQLRHAFLSLENLDDKNNPVMYLRLFLDENVIDVIITETNRYAEHT